MVRDMGEYDQNHDDHEDRHGNVARIVAALMAIHGEKQDALSELLGIARSGISDKLAGRRPWTVDDIARLALHYDVSVAMFFVPAEQVFRAQNWKKMMASHQHFAHGHGGGSRERTVRLTDVRIPGRLVASAI